MIEEHLQRDGCIIYYVNGTWGRTVVATFSTPERAEAWLAVWQDHTALEAERDRLAAQVARVEAVISEWEGYAASGYERAHEPGTDPAVMADYIGSSIVMENFAAALRAALADPDPAPAGTRTALDEIRADQEQQSIHNALIAGITELQEWNAALADPDPAPDEDAEDAADSAAIQAARATAGLPITFEQLLDLLGEDMTATDADEDGA